MKAGKVAPEIDAKIRAEVAVLADRFDARKDLSRETAAMLFFRYGLYPSVQLVYSYTRKGSLTDISKDLDEFWRSIRDKARVRIEGVDLPEDVLTRTGEVLGSLWALAVQKANEVLDGQREEAQARVEQARLAAEQAEQLMRQAIVEAGQAKADADAAHAQREEAERLLAIERTEKLAALQRATDAENKTAAEVDARRKAEERFSADLEAERQSRAKSEGWLEGEVRFAKMQIEEARELGRVLKERLTAVESDRSLVEAQLKRQINSQAEELGRLRLEVGELRGRNGAISDERDRLARRVEKLLARLEQNSAYRSSRLKAKIREGLRAQLVNKPAAFELAERLEVELSFASSGGDDEPELLYLGVPSPTGNRPITPSFRTLDELEAFCDQYQERYEGIDLADGSLPETWFWEKKT
ncbi:MAG: DNA-binding protein [Azoarcus sp.]